MGLFNPSSWKQLFRYRPAPRRNVTYPREHSLLFSTLLKDLPELNVFYRDECWWDHFERYVGLIAKLDVLLAPVVRKTRVAAGAVIEEGVTIKGPVLICDRVHIRSGAYIVGPVIIGEDSLIGPNCFLNRNLVIGPGARITQGAELKNSILGSGVYMFHFSYIGDSLIGSGVNIAAGVITAVQRLDKKKIRINQDAKQIETGCVKFGAIVGNQVQLGVGALIMPGASIAPGAMVSPGHVVKGIVHGSGTETGETTGRGLLKHFHLLTGMEQDDNGYRLYCRCTADRFAELADIVCEGETPFSCSFQLLSEEDNEVRYRVDLPAPLPEDRHYFTAVSQSGEKKGVWRPDDTLDPEGLLPGFFFQHTYLNLTFQQGVSMARLAADPANCHAVVTSISRKQSSLIFSGILFLPLHVPIQDDVQLHIVRFRDESVRTSHFVSVEPEPEKIFGLYQADAFERFSGYRVLRFRCPVDMEKIMGVVGYYSILFEHNRFQFAPKNHSRTLSEKDHCFPVKLSFWKRALIVPYHNEFNNRWRLDIYHLNILEWQQLKKLRSRCETRPIEKDPKIWLIGEYGTTARDNGMHFYNFLCAQKKRAVSAYYVLYRDSGQRHHLRGKNVIYFGSYKHFLLSARAGVLIFSHLPELLLAKDQQIVGYRNRLDRYKTVFLQHGVIALKSDIEFYSRKARNFDLFVASSGFEQDVIHSSFGYARENIMITGLARWDRLYAADHKRVQDDRTILVAPTWRFDFEQVDEQAFQQSPFFRFWNGLLTDPALLNALESSGTRVRFLAHIGFQHFRDLFGQSELVTLAEPDEVGDLLKDSVMMVTDYSSAAFDMLYQGKPVLFCTFDLAERLAKGQAQFIDLETELPGPLCPDMQSAVQEMINHIERGFTMEDKYLQRRTRYFAYIDGNNCERIYQGISRNLGLGDAPRIS